MEWTGWTETYLNETYTNVQIYVQVCVIRVLLRIVSNIDIFYRHFSQFHYKFDAM
jgi:hypothetical protein